MKIAAQYSFNHGLEIIETKFPSYLEEIKDVILNADAAVCKVKKSEEKTMTGRLLYSPVELNKQFKKYFNPKGWKSKRVTCNYKNDFYVNGYTPRSVGERAYSRFRGCDRCFGRRDRLLTEFLSSKQRSPLGVKDAIALVFKINLSNFFINNFPCFLGFLQFFLTVIARLSLISPKCYSKVNTIN